MADKFSFDIFSEIDTTEVLNAVNQASKELLQRFDLKNSNSSIDLNQDDLYLTICSQDEYTLGSVLDVLRGKLTKRGVPLKCLGYETIEPAQGGTVRQKITLQQGINKEKAKDIVKDIKALKLKVQAQIMEDKIRVSGAKKDELQQVIVWLKNEDYGIHLDVGNYR